MCVVLGKCITGASTLPVLYGQMSSLLSGMAIKEQLLQFNIIFVDQRQRKKKVKLLDAISWSKSFA